MRLRNDNKEGDKFLGKEVAYYEGIFRLWLKIMEKVSSGEDITNLVNHLEASFPYKDRKYKKAMEEATKVLRAGLEATDRFGRPNMLLRKKAISEFTSKKYEEILKLFKRKSVVPQEAEVQMMGEHPTVSNDILDSIEDDVLIMDEEDS